jgi:hypothetical protein
MRQPCLLLAAALSSAMGCSDASANLPRVPASPASSLTVIVVDRSTSRPPAGMKQDRDLLADLIGDLGFGDQVVVLEARRSGLSDSVRRWTAKMPRALGPAGPTPVDQQALGQARSSAALAARALFDNTRANRTDLLASLFEVGELMRGAHANPLRLIILSDMLQSTPELDFERHAPPGAAWIGQMQQSNRLPDLAGSCVVVIGADRSTKSGASVFQFWTAYFAASHAKLSSSDYRYTVLDAKSLRCG